MTGRRISLAGRDTWTLAVVAVLGGTIASAAGASPTEHHSIDVLLVLVPAALTIAAAAAAPWWLPAAAVAIGSALAPSWGLVALGVLTVGAAFATRGGPRSSATARAAVAAGAVNVLIRIGHRWFLGATAIVGIGLCAVLLVVGLARGPRSLRRAVTVVLGCSAAVAAAGVVGLVVAATSSRTPLERADDAARDAIDQLADGDFSAARAAFQEANAEFAAAADQLSSGWARMAGVVPVVAQYQSLGADLSQQATRITGTIADVLGEVDVEAMRLTGGQIDVDAVERAQQPLHDLLGQLDELDAVLQGVRSPWLARQVRDRVEELRTRVVEQRDRGQRLVDVVDVAPALLGADGPRRYFLAFTAPTQARPVGGTMANWAEITVTDGRIELTDFGRTGALTDRLDAASATLTGLDEFVTRYAGSGFVASQDGAVLAGVWRDVTVSPHWPSDAQLITELYAQSGGRPLDGVFALDVDAVVALMQFTSPVDLPWRDEPLTVDDARQYLLVDQYREPDRADGTDGLDLVALDMVTQLLTTPLPPPPDLADVFSPLVRGQHLVGWVTDPDELALFEQLGMDGSMPDPDGGDGLMVAIANAGDDELDAFLDVAVDYSVVLDPTSGTFDAVLTVELANGVPADRLPEGAAGTAADTGVAPPPGTSELWLSLYLGERTDGVAVDGEAAAYDATTEARYQVASAAATLAPGQRSTVVAHVAGRYDPAAGYSLVVRTQPAVRPFITTVTIREGVQGTPVTTAIAEPGVVRITGP